MLHSAERTATGVQGRAEAVPGARDERRHPLVAAAIVLPMALVLAVLFGAFEVMASQAHSLAALLEG